MAGWCKDLDIDLGAALVARVGCPFVDLEIIVCLLQEVPGCLGLPLGNDKVHARGHACRAKDGAGGPTNNRIAGVSKSTATDPTALIVASGMGRPWLEKAISKISLTRTRDQ